MTRVPREHIIVPALARTTRELPTGRSDLA
jgi:hypothetical protein